MPVPLQKYLVVEVLHTARLLGLDQSAAHGGGREAHGAAESLGSDPAVNGYDLASDVAGSRHAKKGNRSRRIAWFAEPA
eukprot:CAMPEP_0183335046 /NCGR_PEP_ID=MMETSP0164_2-20130417/3461_1 /TAXON_ID=221442 /ORGANISM="Coccolithus pelagicus ssp braarudi, Strain PLY182g" /LENGTH=78 /DNA_ID=CAMNT_0025504317 /DNA_START=256 /DNA_END=491 /DNA_ORIENTATION=+